MDDLINVSIFRNIFKNYYKIVIFQRKILGILSGEMNENLSSSDTNAQWENEWWKKELAWKGVHYFSLLFLYFAGWDFRSLDPYRIDFLKYKIEETIAYLHVHEVISGGNIDSATQIHSSCDSFSDHIKLDLWIFILSVFWDINSIEIGWTNWKTLSTKLINLAWKLE